MGDFSVEDPENARIPERMGVRTSLGRYDHNIVVGARINDILISAHIVGGIVDTQSFCSKNPVILDSDGRPVVIGELRFVTIELIVEQPSENVVL